MTKEKLAPVLTRDDFDTDDEYHEYLDIEASADGEVQPATDAQKADAKAWAESIISGERVPVTIKIPKRNVSRLKAKALEQDMPYQTLINAIIARYLTKG